MPGLLDSPKSLARAVGVILVHFTFAVTALVVVQMFSNASVESILLERASQPSDVKWSVFVNCVLLLLFGIQHLFAFPVLENSQPSPRIDGGTFDLESWVEKEAGRSRSMILLTLSMYLIVYFWQPLKGVVWDFRDWRFTAFVVRCGFYLAWILLFLSRARQGTPFFSAIAVL